MWSLAGREAKPYGKAGRAVDLPPDLIVLSMRCNCDGTKVKKKTTCQWTSISTVTHPISRPHGDAQTV